MNKSFFLSCLYINTVYTYIIKHVCISHTHKSMYDIIHLMCIYIYMCNTSYIYIHASYIYASYIYNTSCAYIYIYIILYIYIYNVFTTTKPVVFSAPWIFFYGFHVHGPDVHISPWGRLAQEEERNQFRADHLPGPARISQGCEENELPILGILNAFRMVSWCLMEFDGEIRMVYNRGTIWINMGYTVNLIWFLGVSGNGTLSIAIKLW